MIAYIIVGIIAYLIGSISFSVIVSKLVGGFDVREKGSGNAGTTNVLRTLGKVPALITLIGDILKGVIAIALAILVGKMVGKTVSEAVLVQVASVLVVIGHMFPIFFGFKGGKGVATSLGVITVINPLSGIICLLFAIVLMVITKMVSLSVMLAAVLFPILIIFFAPNYFIFALVIVLLLIYRHRANIKRIVSGNENKISFDK